MDKNALKVQALLEKISELVSNYENRCADLRVDITLLAADRDALLEQVKTLTEQTEPQDGEAGGPTPDALPKPASDEPVGERPEDFDK